MAFALVGSAIVTGSSGGTTTGLDTTGANLIVLSTSVFAGASFTLSDNKSNTWTAVDVKSSGNYTDSRLYYCSNPTVGAGHTFTISGSGLYGGVEVSAWSGAASSSPLDNHSKNGTTGLVSSLASGSITPTQDNCLVVFSAGCYGANFSSWNTGSVLNQLNWSGTPAVGHSVYRVVQTTAAAINPTINLSGSAGLSVQTSAFKAASGGTTDLVIADATHAHSADSLVLTSAHLLTVADAAHAHAADNLSLTTQVLLAIAEALHAHTADSLTLTAASVLTVADAAHAHAADAPVLTAASMLAVADAAHGHTADSLSLTTLSVLVVAEALHDHLADNLVLGVTGEANLVIGDAAHAHASDNLSLTSQLALSIADAAHAHASDNLVITVQSVLAVADAIHAHLADNITLSDVPSLNIAEASHAHTAGGLMLTSDSLLTIADAAHAHLADNADLTYAAVLAIIEAIHAHVADNVVLNFDLISEIRNILAKDARFTQLRQAAAAFSQNLGKTVEF